jgi:hypothetical protein
MIEHDFVSGAAFGPEKCRNSRPRTDVLGMEEPRTSIQPDGTAPAMKTIHAIARSTQGQIYNESRPLVPASFTGTPPIRVMHIYDPQTRLNTFLYPQQKTGWQGRTPHSPSTVAA